MSNTKLHVQTIDSLACGVQKMHRLSVWRQFNVNINKQYWPVSNIMFWLSIQFDLMTSSKIVSFTDWNAVND